MRSFALYSLAACLSGAFAAAYNITYTGYPPEYCVGSHAATKKTSPPNKWGIILFQAYEPLDVWGPYEALFTLARTTKVDVSFLAETMDPVTTRPRMASMNKFNSSAFVSVPPTHTFATAPSDLEVLLVPGGAGARAPDSDLKATLDFIKETYPKLKYLITVCTGSMVVARTGLLSGVRATTNKAAWTSVVATDPTAHWIPHARWAVDGNIWSSSGVSAGIDATLAWISCLYGDDVARNVTNAMEYDRHTDSSFDPFADLYNVTAPGNAFGKGY